MDPEALQHLLGDPEALLADLLTPGHAAPRTSCLALTTAIGAYVDHVTAAVAGTLAGARPPCPRPGTATGSSGAKGEQAAGALSGSTSSREQVDRGAAFVNGVVERAGEEGLARLWESARTLPTPAEVDAPGLWLERISLPELDDPATRRARPGPAGGEAAGAGTAGVAPPRGSRGPTPG